MTNDSPISAARWAAFHWDREKIALALRRKYSGCSSSEYERWGIASMVKVDCERNAMIEAVLVAVPPLRSEISVTTLQAGITGIVEGQRVRANESNLLFPEIWLTSGSIIFKASGALLVMFSQYWHSGRCIWLKLANSSVPSFALELETSFVTNSCWNVEMKSPRNRHSSNTVAGGELQGGRFISTYLERIGDLPGTSDLGWGRLAGGSSSLYYYRDPIWATKSVARAGQNSGKIRAQRRCCN
ncbi:hypothetical protein C8R43DRAFT_961440 [Mycena crocata]|nr:hypothetical protein C8R43DRAFT_961440 [Mycena crocata]